MEIKKVVLKTRPEINRDHRADKTVVDFIALLEKNNLSYAIARNYENFPSFGHDLDIFVNYEDVDRIVEISVELACVQGWDYVTRCDWDIWFH
jgi:hypothetical protein